jgi:hypothetical protein
MQVLVDCAVGAPGIFRGRECRVEMSFLNVAFEAIDLMERCVGAERNTVRAVPDNWSISLVEVVQV